MAGPYDSRAVANEILRVAGANDFKLTLMQLIKLVYIANGWSLALLNRPLLSEQVQAWQYGPVIPSVYKAFNRFASAPITEMATDRATGLPYSAALDADETTLIDSVVRGYGHMHAFTLSNIMHQPGTPWSETFNSTGVYSRIPEEVIKAHFIKLKEQRSGAQNSN